MPTKLGIHAQAWKPASELYVKGVQPALVVTMDLGAAARIKALSPNTLVIGRCWECGDGSDVPAMIAKMWQGSIDAMIGPNEPDRNLAALYEQEKYRMDKFHEQGFRAVVCNFATGTCPIPGEWPDGFSRKFVEQIVNQGHLLGLHAYGSPMQFSSEWLTLRYRQMVDELRRRGWPVPQIAITECGIDYIQAASAGPGVWAGKTNGWRNKCDIAEYARQLTWFEGEIQQDSYVVGAAIFQIGTSDDAKWGAFELGPDTQTLINALPKVSKPVGDITNYVGYASDRGMPVKFLILHETVGGENRTPQSWVDYWRAAGQDPNNPTSTHATVMLDGTAVFTVPLTMGAAAAGYGMVDGFNTWNSQANPPRPEPNLNRAAVHIEIVTMKDMPAGYVYPAAQVAKVEAITRQWLLAFPGLRIFSHNEVDTLAVMRGMNPGQAHHDPRQFDIAAFRARIQGAPVPPPKPAPGPDWSKVVWAGEETARILQNEGLAVEHDWIIANWITPAIVKRDAK